MKKDNLFSRRGFTLIELLVAMAIIAILATVGLGSFFNSQIKGRDAQRKSDLGQIQKGLEMYLNDHGRYPEADEFTWGAKWEDSSGELYMKEMPQDSKSSEGATYYYQVPVDDSGSWYSLYAKLENEKDSQAETGGYSGTDCGDGDLCNYKVSSPNAP
jgi:prepilin-type N-terminal cleavage/methylation domain-containing protein